MMEKYSSHLQRFRVCMTLSQIKCLYIPAFKPQKNPVDGQRFYFVPKSKEGVSVYPQDNLMAFSVAACYS